MNSDEYNAMMYILRTVKDKSFYEELYQYSYYGDYLIKNYLTENWIDVNLTKEGIQLLNTNNFMNEMIRLFYLSI